MTDNWKPACYDLLWDKTGCMGQWESEDISFEWYKHYPKEACRSCKHFKRKDYTLEPIYHPY